MFSRALPEGKGHGRARKNPARECIFTKIVKTIENTGERRRGPPFLIKIRALSGGDVQKLVQLFASNFYGGKSQFCAYKTGSCIGTVI